MEKHPLKRASKGNQWSGCMRIRVGINGFGRIGRALFRIARQDERFEVVALNDIDPNVENHAYLAKFDSHYGRLHEEVSGTAKEKCLRIGGRTIPFHAAADMADVPWQTHEVDVVIDASGVETNLASARALIDARRVPKVIVTNAPAAGTDATVVFGVNEHAYDPARHHVLSASICDVMSSAVVLGILDRHCGIRSGFVTTMHPWLSYQNLLDGSVKSVANPGHYWDDFALGRASNANLIPKKTTLVPALAKVLPQVADKIMAMSFRVPTAAVTVSDLVLELGSPTTAEAVNALLKERAGSMARILGYQEEQRVSSDFMGIEQSVFVDGRWTAVNNEGRTVRLVLWYDNEWGYSQRVADLAVLAGKRHA
jgi:glyceraldehyde 3-phosphate dehydrogenase